MIRDPEAQQKWIRLGGATRRLVTEIAALKLTPFKRNQAALGHILSLKDDAGRLLGELRSEQDRIGAELKRNARGHQAACAYAMAKGLSSSNSAKRTS